MSILKVPIVDMMLTNKKARPGKKIIPTHVCVHWTASQGPGADADAIARYFERGERAASAHYAVDSEKVVRCIPENEMSYSVGANKYTPFALKNIGAYPNAHVISIEMCVNSDGHFWSMYSNTARLCAEIMNRYKMTADKLIRHYDVTGKTCPAFFVSEVYAQKYMKMSAAEGWKKFKADVERLRKEK